jgi:hypothetical protein
MGSAALLVVAQYDSAKDRGSGGPPTFTVSE